ncbi:MAG: helix-turn-helix domain-containing protein [Salinigranum sp.]
MADAVRAELRIGGTNPCEIVELAQHGSTVITDVTRTSVPDADGRITVQFSMERAPRPPALQSESDCDCRENAGPTSADVGDVPDRCVRGRSDCDCVREGDDFDSLKKIFTRGTTDVYWLRQDAERGCACERIEHLGCPIDTICASDGNLFVSFYAPDIETIRDAVTTLRRAGADVHLRQLYGSGEGSSGDPVYVDRRMFTARQREVLETAHEMGYFSHPKGANAGTVAEALDISSTTFAEHIALAQGKLLDCVLNA